MLLFLFMFKHFSQVFLQPSEKYYELGFSSLRLRAKWGDLQ
jgi:hypothetical protein